MFTWNQIFICSLCKFQLPLLNHLSLLRDSFVLLKCRHIPRPLLYYYYFCQSIWQRSSGKQQIHVCRWIDVVDRPGHCRLDEGSRNRCVDGWCQVMGKGGTVWGHLMDGWKMEWQRQTDSVSVQKPSSATVNWQGLFYDTSVLNSWREVPKQRKSSRH